MKDILELTEVIMKHKSLKNSANRLLNKKTKIGKLFHALSKKKVKSDKDAVKILYSGKRINFHNFVKLKSNLR